MDLHDTVLFIVCLLILAYGLLSPSKRRSTSCPGDLASCCDCGDLNCNDEEDVTDAIFLPMAPVAISRHPSRCKDADQGVVLRATVTTYAITCSTSAEGAPSGQIARAVSPVSARPEAICRLHTPRSLIPKLDSASPQPKTAPTGQSGPIFQLDQAPGHVGQMPELVRRSPLLSRLPKPPLSPEKHAAPAAPSAVAPDPACYSVVGSGSGAMVKNGFATPSRKSRAAGPPSPVSVMLRTAELKTLSQTARSPSGTPSPPSEGISATQSLLAPSPSPVSVLSRSSSRRSSSSGDGGSIMISGHGSLCRSPGSRICGRSSVSGGFYGSYGSGGCASLRTPAQAPGSRSGVNSAVLRSSYNCRAPPGQSFLAIARATQTRALTPSSPSSPATSSPAGSGKRLGKPNMPRIMGL